MNHKLLPFCIFLSLLAYPAFSTAQALQPGDLPSYSFSAHPLNGNGLARLEDLRGRPVLIEFWGMKCPPCVGSAVPSALKMAETYGDDLGLILVESQGHTPAQVATFALGKKWFGTGAMWTTERPFQTGARGVPNYALLSNEGKVLLMGNPISDHKKIQDAIAQELRRARAVPDGIHRELGSAWKEFARGNVGKALSTAAKLAESPDAELAAAATDANQDFRSQTEGRFGRVRWLVENGRFHAADEALGVLAKATKGDDHFEELATRLLERLSDRSLQQERAAEKQFLRLEHMLFQKGPEDPIIRALRQFTEKHADTKAAERAQYWMKILGA